MTLSCGMPPCNRRQANATCHVPTGRPATCHVPTGRPANPSPKHHPASKTMYTVVLSGSHMAAMLSASCCISALPWLYTMSEPKF
jgi:hypothetical protein